MQPSSLKLRREFYKKEFDLKAAKVWFDFRSIENTAFAVIIGRHSKIYLKKFEKVKNDVLIIDDHGGLEDVLEYIIYYLPEGVYYDRNVYKDLKVCIEKRCDYKNCWECENFLGQELAFDIDPENIDCPYHGTLKDKLEKNYRDFCMVEYKRARKKVVELYEVLKNDFKNIRLVFSGRGFHIHVLDKRAFKLSRSEREEIAQQFSEYAIDEWVTSGEMRLIRLPYSLNGVSSRICLPIELEQLLDFDPRSSAIPISSF